MLPPSVTSILVLAAGKRQSGSNQIENHSNLRSVPRRVDHDDVLRDEAHSRDGVHIGPTERDRLRREERRKRRVEAGIRRRVKVGELPSDQERGPRTACLRRREPQSAGAGNRDGARTFGNAREGEESVGERGDGRWVRLLVELRVRVGRRRRGPRAASLSK